MVFRQINKLKSEYHKRRIYVRGIARGWNTIPIARLTFSHWIFSVGENKGREIYDLVSYTNVCLMTALGKNIPYSKTCKCHSNHKI